ncbi:MAG: gliding motility-associated C-terminal domain-containing protein [Bacteroidia bacterium]|nr:gliding motility-associated C-terminal domain-containing protein [Bacteroidia bacterium]
MANIRKYIAPHCNSKISSYIKGIVYLCLAVLNFSQNTLFAQVISNNGAAISVTSGVVVNSKDFENTSGSLGNNGTINLNGNYSSTATTNGNGIFRIGGNWTTNAGGIFTPGLSTVIFNGFDNQSITRLGGETFYHLSIENSGAQASKTVSLSNNVTVTDTLSIKLGNINTSTYKLLLLNQTAASLKYSSVTGSRIIGKFERGIGSTPGTFLFPLGSLLHYNPANLSTNSVLSSGTILSEFVTSPSPGNTGLPFPDPPVEVFREYPDGFWNLKANGFSTGDYNINLNGTGFVDTIFDITRVIKRTTGENWKVEGTHSPADTINKVVYRNNLTGNIDPDGTQFALARVRPLITSQPVSLIVCERTDPVFTVLATGAGTLTYIWYHNGVAIKNSSHYSGNKTNSITIKNAVLSDSGYYYCIVRDKDRNSNSSDTVHLTVNKIPVATVSQPAQDHECSEVSFTPIIFGESYGVPGTTYIWSRTNPPGISSPGVPMNGTGMNIGDALSGSFINSNDSPDTIIFTITPVGPDFISYVGSPNISNCVGIPVTATVTVNPKPRVIPVLSKICYGGATSITLTSPSVMTQQNSIRFDYNVTATAPPAILPGNWNSGTNVAFGTEVPITYTNKSDSLQSVYYNITPIIVSALGCPSGDEMPFEIQVHSKTIKYNYPLTNGTGILITKPLTCDISSGLAALRVIVTKGADPYQVSWTGPVGYTNDSIDITNLNAGKYTVRVTDNLGCYNDSSINVIPFTARPQILATPILPNIHVSCPGGSDGSLRVYVSSGITAPYFFWVIRNDADTLPGYGLFTGNYNPSDPNTYKIYNNLKAGNYMLVIRDVNGCEVPRTTELKEPATITVEFQKSNYNGFNVSCLGYSNGSALAQPTGGNGSYSYQWYPATGSLSVSATTNLLDSVPAGKYYLKTTDLFYCTKIDSVTILEPNGIQQTGSELSHSPDGNTNISCNGGNDGFIKMTISGGSGVYIYNWTGPNSFTETTGNISGLKAGNYVCTVTDLNGCILTPSPSFTLTEPAVLAIASSTSTSNDESYNINCNGGTGWINISVSGGSAGTYKYNWSTTDGSGIINGQADQNVLAAGTYHLVVSDSNNCETTKDITLTQPLSLGTRLSATHITCQSPGFNNGSVNLTVSGGVAPYSYLWSNGAITEDIADLTQGCYYVTVTDANSCVKTDSICVNLPPPLIYTKSLSDYNGYNISCNGLSNGSIQINTTSGLAPFVYNWTGPNGFTAITKDISDLKAGQYNLLITDSNYCTATEAVKLTEPGRLDMIFSLSASTAGGFNINCAGSSTGSIGIEPVNQVKTVEYLWYDGIFGKSRINLPAGEYDVIITDANNCHASSKITLTEPDYMKLVFDISQPFCPDKPDGEIRLNVTGGVRGTDYSYKWSENSTSRNISNILKGFYKVLVTDQNGCSIKDSVKINPLNETCLIIPNAISPNNDMINDVWNIGEIELYPKMEIKIFDRGGQSIWKSENGYPQPWDGTSNGSPLPIDSYHYIIDLHNGSKPLVGNITIVR